MERDLWGRARLDTLGGQIRHGQAASNHRRRLTSVAVITRLDRYSITHGTLWDRLYGGAVSMGAVSMGTVSHVESIFTARPWWSVAQRDGSGGKLSVSSGTREYTGAILQHDQA